MKKNEYKTVGFHLLVKGHHQEIDTKKLNDLGLDGWEYVDMISGYCLFKREIEA